MKVLIVDDDGECRKTLQVCLRGYADCESATNGLEAVAAVRAALEKKEPYDLVCLDIVMPQMDGQTALKAIRKVEQEHGIGGLDCVKVIMTSVLAHKDSIMSAFQTGCEGYMVKPIQRGKLLAEIRKVGLTKEKCGTTWGF